MRAWHFCATRAGRPVLRDGSPALGVGETETYDGALGLRTSGLHACPRAIDALTYAPGLWVRRVECDDVLAGVERIVCRRRTVLADADAMLVVADWMRWCALRVVDIWDCPEVVREWLKTGDPKLRAWARAEARAARDAWVKAARDARPAMGAAKTAERNTAMVAVEAAEAAEAAVEAAEAAWAVAAKNAAWAKASRPWLAAVAKNAAWAKASRPWLAALAASMARAAMAAEDEADAAYWAAMAAANAELEGQLKLLLRITP